MKNKNSKFELSPLRLKLFLFAIFVSLLFAPQYYLSNTHASQIILTDPNLQVKTVAQGLQFPASMAFLNPNEILVLEKDEGKVLRVVNGNISGEPVLTLDVNHVFDSGLLGIAIDHQKVAGGNDDGAPKYVFLYYTGPTHEGNATLYSTANTSSKCKNQGCQEIQLSNRLYRYEYKDNKLVNPKLLIDIPIYLNNRVYPTTYAAILNGGHNWYHYQLREGVHVGGKLVLDHDNNIYLVTGDGGGCQSHDGCYRSIKNGFLSTKSANKINGTNPIGMGGILRVTEDGNTVGNNGTIGHGHPLDYYYAYGIRNGFGLDFDPVTGSLWDTENGPHYGDEINLVQPGFNSGWAKIQGIWPIINYSYLYFNTTSKGVNNSSIAPSKIKLEDFGGKGKYSGPEFTWNSSVGVTSIKFLNTNKYGKQYENDILVGDAYGRIYHFDLNKNRTGLNLNGSLSDKVANSDSEQRNLIFGRGFDTITDMQVGPDGYVYVLSYTGKIFKIIPKFEATSN
jgi:aldose sugar dehydrogenase